MLLSSELLSCAVLVAMTTVHCSKTVTKPFYLKSKENLSPNKWNPTVPEASHSFSGKIRTATKIKARQTKRKTNKTKPVAASKTEDRGLTTQRPRPHMRPHPTTADPSGDYTLDELLKADADLLDNLSNVEKEVNAGELRRQALLAAWQANATGRFQKWPFPFTEHAYVHEFNTLKQEMVQHWKNATRDFTELRREYVKESRSLHVAEVFTAYRRRGTHFYTVLGIEGWDGNIFEYPEIPYKYKDNPGSSFSASTREVLTRDPRVLRYTHDDSRQDLNARYRIGRYGEWEIDFPNEPYVSAGPDRIHWPYKWREDDPDNATIMLKDLPTFARKRRALSTARMNTNVSADRIRSKNSTVKLNTEVSTGPVNSKNSTVRMRRKRKRDRNLSILFPFGIGTQDGNFSFSRFAVSGMSKVSKGI